MPAAERRITREDVIANAEFAAQRKARRAALLPLKRLRRLDVGPYCSFYFECFETMLFQIQEMLLVEKGGEEQLADELAAYNPLVPQGAELVATVMFEIDDELRRARILGRLAGVDDRFFIQIGDTRAPGVPEGDIERNREDGKTSSVHFLHFALTPTQIAAFRDPSVSAMVGCDHPLYAHLTVLRPETRGELAKDFAG
ncbi:MAG TPA: DUF3501 family protein [Caulobacteraceae bacterium]|jgi:hypothetical protein|nr:DUF3501 family protein [Caulobacteraceae bacterium]